MHRERPTPKSRIEETYRNERLNHEGFTTTTFFLYCQESVTRPKHERELICNTGGKLTDIGVAENKASAQRILMPVHFTANDAEQGLAVDQNLHTILLDDFVELARLLHVLEVVS